MIKNHSDLPSSIYFLSLPSRQFYPFIVRLEEVIPYLIFYIGISLCKLFVLSNMYKTVFG